MSVVTNFMPVCNNCRRINQLGSRYCVQCGFPVIHKPTVYEDAPKVQRSSIEIRWPQPGNVLILGSEVACSPFFIDSTGNYWHFGRFAHEEDGVAHVEQVFPGYEKGPLIGIVSDAALSPWALVAWKRLVLLYNGFSGTWRKVWQASAKRDYCYRKPAAIAVNQQNGCSLIRMLLVLRGSRDIKFQPIDFVLKPEGRDCEDRWQIEQRETYIGPPLERVVALSAPIILRDTFYSFVIYRTTNRAIKVRELEFMPPKRYSNGPYKRVFACNNVANSMMPLEPERYYQAIYGKSIYFWGENNKQGAEEVQLMSLPIGTVRGSSSTTMLRVHCAMVQNSHLETFRATQGIELLAFSNGSGKLSVLCGLMPLAQYDAPMEKTCSRIGYASMEKLLLWVEESGRRLMKTAITGSIVRHSEVDGQFLDGHPYHEHIQSILVPVQGRLFFLRGSYTGRSTLQLEYVS